MKKVFIAGLAIAAIASSCKNSGKSAAKLENSSDSLSYALGVSIATNLSQSGLDEVNYEVFLKGIQEHMDSTGQMDVEAAETFIRTEMQKMAEKKSENNKKAGEDFLAANKSKAGIQTTASGLQYKITQEGTGAQPDANDKVTVHYHGTTIEGKVFDSSVDRGQPATFGLNQVIPGWTEGLQLLKEGGKATLYIPQELAYGARATGPIEGYSTLIFEVELIKVEPVQ
ncbi:MAG: FKBP-type peptidyl-prolyl cis-trans isomerase [Flavobacteriales bacterium]|jgi:FKBP-type peptidyl-prolyl cis-trans isomerase